MTPSEEMIPRRLRFKIASHVRTADRANQLFKFGSWNRVAENCRELGRFKKCLGFSAAQMWVPQPPALPLDYGGVWGVAKGELAGARNAALPA